MVLQCTSDGVIPLLKNLLWLPVVSKIKSELSRTLYTLSGLAVAQACWTLHFLLFPLAFCCYLSEPVSLSVKWILDTGKEDLKVCLGQWGCDFSGAPIAGLRLL